MAALSERGLIVSLGAQPTSGELHAAEALTERAGPEGLFPPIAGRLCTTLPTARVRPRVTQPLPALLTA